MMETTLYEAPGFRGILRIKKSESRSHSGYLQYVEVEKNGTEKVVHESGQLYTDYEDGQACILEAVKDFYDSDQTKTWLANVRIEDDLRGLNNYERIIQGLLDFCLNT